MNVLVFSTLYPNSAQPNHGLFVEKRVRELRRRTDWRFEVVAPVPWFPLRGDRWGAYSAFARAPRREQRDGIDVHHPRYAVLPGLSWPIAPWLLLAGALRRARRLHERSRFDLVDAHFAFPDGVAAVMIGRALGVPVIVTARGSDVNDSPRHRLPRRLMRTWLGRAAALVAVSGQLAEGLRALLGAGPTVSVLPNGVDTDVFRPRDRAAARERHALDGPVVLTVGNLRPLKGQHLLIDAMAMLDGVTLLIVGEGAEREALERRAVDLGVAARVRFLGSVPNADLPDLYSAADVFVLASSSEGCPNVVLEAMACGTPVVSTAVGAVPELLPEAGLGLMAEERSASALAARIAAALAAPPPAQAYLERARALGWDATCDGLAALFRETVRS